MTKRLLFLLTSILLAVAPVWYFAGTGASLPEDLTIYIATDLHYLAAELDGEESHFASPSAAGDGKAVHLTRAITEGFLQQVIREKPDLLVLSGDLTLNGAPQSHRALTALLAQVQAAGVQVLALPGNHDLNGAAADYTTFDGAQLLTFPAATAEEYGALYATFGREQALYRDEHSLSYIYQADPGLWVVMLDTNTYSKGFVKSETFTWLQTHLREAERRGITVLGVSHQNLYAHNRLLSFGYQLYEGDKLRELYEKHDVAANFSGHIHVQSIVDGQVPEAATAAMCVTTLNYGKVTCSPEGMVYQAQPADLPELAAEARWYFEEVARLQVRQQFAESGLTADEIELLAETFARINSAYFSGERLEAEQFAEGLALWYEQEHSFIHTYMETMLESCSRENRLLKIR